MPSPPSNKLPEATCAGQAIGWATLVAGVLDISSAFIIWGSRGISPIQGLQGIATGYFGAEAFRLGLRGAIIGLATHFLIVFVASSIFYVAARRNRFLTDRPIISGLAYGLAVYAFMTCVVLPFVGIYPKHTILEVMRSMTIVMLLVGLPIALIVRKYVVIEAKQASGDQRA